MPLKRWQQEKYRFLSFLIYIKGLERRKLPLNYLIKVVKGSFLDNATRLIQRSKILHNLDALKARWVRLFLFFIRISKMNTCISTIHIQSVSIGHVRSLTFVCIKSQPLDRNKNI